MYIYVEYISVDISLRAGAGSGAADVRPGAARAARVGVGEAVLAADRGPQRHAAARRARTPALAQSQFVENE